jgi:hypothetical protein
MFYPSNIIQWHTMRGQEAFTRLYRHLTFLLHRTPAERDHMAHDGLRIRRIDKKRFSVCTDQLKICVTCVAEPGAVFVPLVYSEGLLYDDDAPSATTFMEVRQEQISHSIFHTLWHAPSFVILSGHMNHIHLHLSFFDAEPSFLHTTSMAVSAQC